MGIGNPFLFMYFFVKGEMKDITAMMEALLSRQNLIAQHLKYAPKRQVVAMELADC
jgi:hypothetical protein